MSDTQGFVSPDSFDYIVGAPHTHVSAPSGAAVVHERWFTLEDPLCGGDVDCPPDRVCMGGHCI